MCVNVGTIVKPAQVEIVQTHFTVSISQSDGSHPQEKTISFGYPRLC